MKARTYVLRRLLALIPQVVGVTTVVFLLIRLLPGDPAYLMLDHRGIPELAL